MAGAHVQTVNNTATASLSVTSGAIVTSTGSLVVVGGVKNNVTVAVTVSDNKSNSWSENPSSPLTYNTADTVAQFYTENLQNAGSGHTFTVTSSENRDCSIFVSEFRGVLSSSSLDQSTSNAQAANNAPTSGATGTRTQTAEILVVHFGAASANIVSVTAGAGFTVPTNGSILNNASGMPGAIEYQIVNAVGTDEGNFSIGASVATGTIIGTFRIPDSPTFRQRSYRPAPFKPGFAR